MKEKQHLHTQMQLLNWEEIEKMIKDNIVTSDCAETFFITGVAPGISNRYLNLQKENGVRNKNFLFFTIFESIEKLGLIFVCR